MEEQDAGRLAAPPGYSAEPEPKVSALRASIPSAGRHYELSPEMRLKLDQRIHNQRKQNRETWETVERRQMGSRKFYALLLRRLGDLLDKLGVPRTVEGGGQLTIFGRLNLAAQGIEARSDETAQQAQPSGESPVRQDASVLSSQPSTNTGEDEHGE